jgi:hypothetical protein
MKYWPIVFSSIIALSCNSEPTTEERQGTDSDASIVGVWKLDSAVVYPQDTTDINLDNARPYLVSYVNGTLLFNYDRYIVFFEDSTAYTASNHVHRDTLRKQREFSYQHLDQELCTTFSNGFTSCGGNLIYLGDSNMVWLPFYMLGEFSVEEHYSKVSDSELRSVDQTIEY